MQNKSAINTNEFDVLCSLESWNFEVGSVELPRTVSACSLRWKTVLLPILKTHSLAPPKFPQCYFQWMTDVLNHIVNESIKDVDEIDFYSLEKEVCPGQTVASLKQFVKNVKLNKSSDEPLHKTCLRRLDNPLPRFLTNESANGVRLKIKRIEETVNIYKLLIE